MQPIAIIQHVADDGPAYFATWLEQQGHAYQVFRMDQGDDLPAHAADHAGWCVLGGPMSANDALPYYPLLFARLREAVDLRIPLIGHCLGGQIISRVLGGTVSASENVEIGWSDLRVEAGGNAWLAGAAAARFFQWHGESFSIPLGAQRIMTGDYCANQAFVYDDIHLGMQFHCEVTEDKVRRWLVLGHDELIHSTSPAVQQAGALLPDLPASVALSQQMASALYARWWQGVQVRSVERGHAAAQA
ncbi:type 1 glutamine amidotransferase [Chitinimonas sp. BJYL2]|uniref:type 1 glutamine amidotransferase n=1 Tax=Chitinimonas sp. BJYL2 TaxID=2976696 RepID=UPI0022B5A0D7|nr:type 1 glutamine amidotransferase [Chitinimonas sp. BJYL2]